MVETSAYQHLQNACDYLFRVNEEDPETSGPNARAYHLHDRSHKEYLNLFANIAHDFNTRVPLNRRARATPQCRAEFSELLTQNLCPRILYGYGDPGVLRVKAADIGDEEDWYYIVSTSNDAPDAFPIIRSKDLSHWQPRGFIFPTGKQPTWAAVGENKADYWAPELHRINGEFRAYFVARHKQSSELCIGVATASHPDGPFVPYHKPLLRGNRIDPHVFIDKENEAYLYWKEDSNGIWPDLLNLFLFRFPAFIAELFSNDNDRRTACLIATLWPWTSSLPSMERFFVQQTLIEAVISNFSTFKRTAQQMYEQESNSTIRKQLQAIINCLKTPVYVQRLSPDGLRLQGEQRRVLENDQLWEAHVIEGIWVLQYQSKYYMFYSGGDFSTAFYGIGVAVSDSPVGPFEKIPGPFLSSTPKWDAPGHPSAAVGPSGEPVLFVHAYPPCGAGYKQFRALLSIGIQFKGGVPSPGTPLDILRSNGAGSVRIGSSLD